MMFSCCHPRIPDEAQVALVLHILWHVRRPLLIKGPTTVSMFFVRAGSVVEPMEDWAGRNHQGGSAEQPRRAAMHFANRAVQFSLTPKEAGVMVMANGS